MTGHPYRLIYSDNIPEHLRHIPRKNWNLIKETIREQLSYEPFFQTNNRKPLTNPPIDDKWELRFGQKNRFRVFYKANEFKREVYILAIGTKISNRLFIGGQEEEL